MHWKGGEYPPIPLQGTQPMPSRCLTPSASLNGICNRQEPPPTASATSSNRLPNRHWSHL